jgi:hypothetical protein
MCSVQGFFQVFIKEITYVKTKGKKMSHRVCYGVMYAATSTPDHGGYVCQLCRTFGNTSSASM